MRFHVAHRRIYGAFRFVGGGPKACFLHEVANVNANVDAREDLLILGNIQMCLHSVGFRK